MDIRQAIKETIERCNTYYSTGYVINPGEDHVLDEISYFSINLDEAAQYLYSIDIITLYDDGTENTFIVNKFGFSRGIHNIYKKIDYKNISQYVQCMKYDISEEAFFQKTLVHDYFIDDYNMLAEISQLLPKMEELWRRQNDCND